jgi:hypothetical protein
MDGILWAQMRIADFAETGMTGRADFTLIGIQKRTLFYRVKIILFLKLT